MGIQMITKQECTEYIEDINSIQLNVFAKVKVDPISFINLCILRTELQKCIDTNVYPETLDLPEFDLSSLQEVDIEFKRLHKEKYGKRVQLSPKIVDHL